MNIIQWLMIIGAALVMWRAAQLYRRGDLDRRKLIWWIGLWLIVIIVIALPQTTSILASFLGIGRGVDLVVYVAVLVLLYTIFQLSSRLDATERSLTRLVRSLALRDLDRHE